MIFENSLYIINLPKDFEKSEKVQNECKTFNKLVLMALCDIIKTGKVSKKAELMAETIKSPEFKKAYKDSLDWMKDNVNNDKVMQNRLNIVDFFGSELGEPLLNKLAKDGIRGKMINWPLLMQTMVDPNFDFANSSLLQYFYDEAKRLDKSYAKYQTKSVNVGSVKKPANEQTIER